MNATATDGACHPQRAAFDAYMAALDAETTEGLMNTRPSDPARLAHLSAETDRARTAYLGTLTAGMAAPAHLSPTDRLVNRLSPEPWALSAPQAVDFAAWACGLPAGTLSALHALSPGEIASVHERLDNAADQGALKAQWQAARAVPQDVLSAAAEGAAWLL
ncbi:hypothetical protein DM785_02385 [Deinococcus actinosclerus]|nr:hypothetical protein DM785_02385 [Deinococcus actinosclerus]